MRKRIKHSADESLRARIIETCLKMNKGGINHGSSGNVSARLEDGILITPSGMAYERIQPDDIVLVYWDGSYEGDRLPSSEWRFHLDIMRQRADCHAVVHTHAPACTTLACLHTTIPAFHYMVAVAGGHDIRCAGYARFGTQALSDSILAALAGRKACLMANHGMLAIEGDLDRALNLAFEVEYLADVYLRCLQVTRPAILSRQQIDEVVERFSGYGKQPDELEAGEHPAFVPPIRRA